MEPDSSRSGTAKRSRSPKPASAVEREQHRSRRSRSRSRSPKRHHRHHRRDSGPAGSNDDERAAKKDAKRRHRSPSPMQPSSHHPPPIGGGNRRSAASSSDSESFNWSAAREIVRGLCRALPAAVKKDLHTVFTALDAGETVVLGGISNALLRTGLTALCVSLDMRERSGGGYKAPRALRKASLVKNLRPCYCDEDGDDVAAAAAGAGVGPSLPGPGVSVSSSSSSAAAAPAAAAAAVPAASQRTPSAASAAEGAAAPPDPQPRVLGPMRPPTAEEQLQLQLQQQGEEEEEEEDCGPRLPWDPRARTAATAAVAVEAEQAAGPLSSGADAGRGRPEGGREGWMSLAASVLGGGTGGEGQKQQQGDANKSFSTKSAPRAGIGWAYLKKGSDEGDPELAAAAAAERLRATRGICSSAVAPAPVPAAPTATAGTAAAAAAAAKGYMDAFNTASRPQSLVDLHRGVGGAPSSGAAAAAAHTPIAAAAAPAKPAAPAARRPFDRERDLAITRPAMDAGKVIDKAAGLYGRFGAGKFEKSFL